MGTDREARWAVEDLHIAGRVFVALERRGLEQSARVVLRDINGGVRLDAVRARRMLGRSPGSERTGDVFVLDAAGEGIYVLAPARCAGHKPWTVVTWMAVVPWARLGAA
jgi:hypothetical protein